MCIRVPYECRYLHMTGDTYGRPIPGQREVSAVSSPASGGMWRVAEGIYIKPNESKGIHSADEDDVDEHDEL